MKKEILFLLAVMAGFALIQTLHFGQGTKDTGPLLVQADDETFNQKISENGEWILVKFWAPWCGACRRLMPTVKELAEIHQEDLAVVAVNVDEAERTASEFGANSIPLLVLLRNGYEVDRMVGNQPLPVLEAWMARHRQPAAAEASP